MKVRNEKLKLLVNGTIAAVVTGVFAFWAMSLSDLEDVATGLTSSPVSGWVACSAMMAAVTLCRYMRIQFCVPAAPVLSLYRASALHGAAISVLPGKIGEAVLPLALRQLANIPFLGGAGLLLLIRAFDMAALITLAMIAYGLAGVAEPDLQRLVVIVMPITILLLMATPIIVIYGLRFLPKGDHFFGRMISSVTAALAIMPLWRLYLVLCNTILLWVFLAAATFFSISAVGLEPTPVNAMLAVALASFAFALPINGIASIGPFEAAFAFGLGLFGMPLDPSIAAAAHLHICAVGVALIAALFGQLAVMVVSLKAESVMEVTK